MVMRMMTKSDWEEQEKQDKEQLEILREWDIIKSLSRSPWVKHEAVSERTGDNRGTKDNYDPIEKPEHYNQGGIEAIEYIKQQLGPSGYPYYLLGNVIKYIHRHDYKGNALQDLKKAKWYLDKYIETWE